MTSREKNLILVVISIILVALFWFFLYKPISEKTTVIKAEINTMNTALNDLTLEYIKKDVYLEEISDMTKFIEAIEARYPAFTPQEMLINTMINLEDEIESLKIPAYTMNRPIVVISDGEYKDEATGELKYKETLIKTQSSLDLEMTYADMKKMLAYIRNSKNKLSIEGMQMTSDLASDIIATSFNLNFYSLLSEDRVLVPEDYFGPFEPKEESIFKPYEAYGTNFDSGEDEDALVVEREDIVLNLSTIYADRSTVIIYENNDVSGDSYVYADNNELEPLEIVFGQIGESYTYKYKTSVEQYPSGYLTGTVFEPGNYIDVAVYSSSKVDENDNSGVNATIINNTDLPVNINVISDDVNTPRFNIISQTGIINITK